MIALLVLIRVHGWNLVLIYWVTTAFLGVWLDALNLRHAQRQIRAVRPGEPDERPMRASTLGYLLLHLAVGIFLAIAVLAGVALLVGSLTAGLTLQFTDRASAMAVIGLSLVIPTAPTLTAALFCLWRWWTLRALRR